MASPDDLQSQVSAVPWSNKAGLVTGATLFGLFSSIIAVLYTMGTWSSSGVYTPNIPDSTITRAMLQPGVGGGSVTLVPQRVVAGSGAAAALPTDFLVCLNGPTELDLETAPPLGTTHVVKDCRAAAGAPIAIVPSGATIDGAPTYSMTVPAQSITVTFTSLGWSVY